MITVLATGPLTTVQDLGRFGYAALGVGRAGAADPVALRTANRLVGNPDDSAGLEITLGGLTVELGSAATIALTGARCPADVDTDVALSLSAGRRIRLGVPAAGLRTYLAVRGGIGVAPVLGSRSTDTLSGLGPPVVRPGDVLPVGPAPAGVVSGVVSGLAAIEPEPDRPLRVIPGPRDDWFQPAAFARLVDTAWVVRPDSDRIGLRLDGPALTRRRPGELPSEATLPGALQVPPDGRPILLGPDAPVTGGYPVIAVVHSADRHRAGQLRPGQSLRFRAVAR
jgi:biotin-dependent carboxylase-like uncharacterized protein